MESFAVKAICECDGFATIGFAQAGTPQFYAPIDPPWLRTQAGTLAFQRKDWRAFPCESASLAATQSLVGKGIGRQGLSANGPDFPKEGI